MQSTISVTCDNAYINNKMQDGFERAVCDNWYSMSKEDHAKHVCRFARVERNIRC